MMFFVTPRWFGWDGFRRLTTILILQVTVVASADALVATYIQTFPGILAWQLEKKTSRCTFTTSWVKLCSSFWPGNSWKFCRHCRVQIIPIQWSPMPVEAHLGWNQGQKNRKKNEWQNALQHQNKHLWTSQIAGTTWFEFALYAKNLPNQALYGCQWSRLKRHADSSVQTWFTDLRFM